jgi:hypothetical protein
LFDRSCKLNEASFTITAGITAVDINSRTITISASEPNGWFSNGRVVINGRYYAIEASTGGVLRMANRPFDAAARMEVSVVPGCNKYASDCRKFSNCDNFGGFSLVPFISPNLVGA